MSSHIKVGTRVPVPRMQLGAGSGRQGTKSGPPKLKFKELHQVFALTPLTACPYIEGLFERKIVTPLAQSDSRVSALNWSGFRRSHNMAYRPACPTCNLCKAVRVDVAGFKPGKSQKRTIAKGSGLQRVMARTVSTPEHFALFNAYVSTRHGDGDMAEMGSAEFRAMIEETPVSSLLFEWRQAEDMGGGLVAACLVDVMIDGLSMVYSYFDPKFEEVKGLGTFMILDLISFSREQELPYLYLGYWIQSAAKMDYKTRFQPMEVHAEQGWELL